MSGHFFSADEVRVEAARVVRSGDCPCMVGARVDHRLDRGRRPGGARVSQIALDLCQPADCRPCSPSSIRHRRAGISARRVLATAPKVPAWDRTRRAAANRSGPGLSAASQRPSELRRETWRDFRPPVSRRSRRGDTHTRLGGRCRSYRSLRQAQGRSRRLLIASRNVRPADSLVIPAGLCPVVPRAAKLS